MKKEIAYPFGIDEIRFMRCFTTPSFRIFVALLIGWTLTVLHGTAKRSVTPSPIW
jgi:hypothetical protein